MLRYKLPALVNSPKKYISSVLPVYDGGLTSPFSIAIVKWDGVDRIGIRWNVNDREWDDSNKKSGLVECLGEPNSRGYSTWFILPDDFLYDLISNNGNLTDKIKDALDGIKTNESNQKQ